MGEVRAAVWAGKSRPSGPARSVARRWLPGALLLLAATVLAVSAAVTLGGPARALGPHQLPAAPAPSQNVKYYIVGEPVNGQREFLYQIAAKVLGNGNRWQEIYDLNKDRLQPDGQRLSDPLNLQPGWILLLPADANGLGVHTGPLPEVSAVLLPSLGPPSHEVPTAAPDARDSTASAPNGSSDPSEIAATVLVGLAVVGWVVFFAYRRRNAAVAPSPSRAPVAALIRRRAVPGHRTAGPAGPSGTAAGIPPGPVEAAQLADLAPTELSATVTGYGVRATVSLLGRRGGGTAFTWRPRAAGSPGGRMPAPLGEYNGRTLYVDLALAPDVVTVLGRLADSQRYARELADHLIAVGVPVTVLGDALGPRPPARCRRISELPEPGPAGSVAPTGVLFCADPPADVRRAAVDLGTRGGGHLVPVLLGDVPRARWSVRVGVPDAAGTADRPARAGDAGSPGRRGGSVP
jgi:hypothetical protein